MDFILSYLKLPLTSDTMNAKLSGDVTEEELIKAISRLKTNKSPGPDGFASEWYKTFSKLLQFYYQLLIIQFN